MEGTGTNNGGGGFTSGDAVLWGAMNNMGGRGGAWGNGGRGGGWDTFASPGSNAVRIDANGQVLGKAMDANGRAFDSATIAERFARVCDKISDSEFRAIARNDAVAREAAAEARAALMAAHAAEIKALECCCENKLLVKEENAKTRELIIQGKLDAAVAQNTINETVAKTVAALGAIHHP